MTQSTEVHAELRTQSPERKSRRGLALAVVLITQLMVVLDVTIVNVALPDIRPTSGSPRPACRGSSTPTPSSFGGLLLLGARAGDILGRGRVFIIGIGAVHRSPRSPADSPIRPACCWPPAPCRASAPRSPHRPRWRSSWHVPRGPRSAPGPSATTPPSPSAARRIGLIAGGMLTQWRVLALGVLRQRADRHRWCWSSPRRAAARDAAHRGQFDVLGARHLDARHDGAGLRLRPGGRATAGATPGTLPAFAVGLLAAGRVRLRRAARDGPDHAAAAVRRPGPGRRVRGPAAAGRRHDGHVLLPHPVPAGRAAAIAARDRPGVPAADRRWSSPSSQLVGPGAGRPVPGQAADVCRR